MTTTFKAAFAATAFATIAMVGVAAAPQQAEASEAAAAIIGFGAGAVVGSAIANSQPRYYAPAPRYYAPAPRYVAPRRVVHTNNWHAYCASKYRSYNPATGMYLSYSGQYRYCR